MTKGTVVVAPARMMPLTASVSTPLTAAFQPVPACSVTVYRAPAGSVNAFCSPLLSVNAVLPPACSSVKRNASSLAAPPTAVLLTTSLPGAAFTKDAAEVLPDWIVPFTLLPAGR